jgi:hypothetical protein
MIAWLIENGLIEADSEELDVEESLFLRKPGTEMPAAMAKWLWQELGRVDAGRYYIEKLVKDDEIDELERLRSAGAITSANASQLLSDRAVLAALKGGQLGVLQWLFDNKAPLLTDTSPMAAVECDAMWNFYSDVLYGRRPLATLKWLRAHGRPWPRRFVVVKTKELKRPRPDIIEWIAMQN